MAIFGKRKKRTHTREVRAGDLLNQKFLVERCIGEGGFARVFRGVQLSTGQQVAIKLLNRAEIDPDYRDEVELRFKREMQTYTRLHHPNLVRLVDSGQLENMFFLVLEYLEGRSLSDVVYDDGPLEPFEAKHLMMQCIDALGCAHAQGIAHRDFKPSNVHVVQTGTQRNAVILDFGLAGPITGWDHTLGNRVTKPGTLVGSVSYISPEQIRGEVTVQSDIYAWGLVYLEILTGRKARRGKSQYDVIMRHIKEDVEIPPSIASHRLGDILRRATARPIEDRYQSAAEVIRDLTLCSMGDLELDALPPEPPDAPPELPEALSDDDLKYLAMLPEPPPEAKLERAELESLYREYSRALRDFDRAVPVKEDFFDQIRRNSERWRDRLGCEAVRYEVLVDDDSGRIQLKPVPIF